MDMRKFLIICASATTLGIAALSAPQALAHGGGGGGGHGSHGPSMGMGMGSMNHGPEGGGMNHHDPMQKADFRDHRKKGYRHGHGSDGPDFGDDDDDDDDGCTRVSYQGRMLWACE
jgi:hypothetical protein